MSDTTKERGRIVLNYDGPELILSISPPLEEAGTTVHMRQKFKTPEVAQVMAQAIADRLGLRRRGSGWFRAIADRRKASKR